MACHRLNPLNRVQISRNTAIILHRFTSLILIVALLTPTLSLGGSLAKMSQEPGDDRALLELRALTSNTLVSPNNPGRIINPPLAASSPCNLYPIALSSTSLTGVATGGLIGNIFNGTQPGNFGWLTWSGSSSEPALVASLTPPGNSGSYVNPNNAADHEVSVGDWVRGNSGISNSAKVRNALDALKTLDITVPVWNESRGQGSNALYRVTTFAQVQLLSYELPSQNRISARFLGYTECPTPINQAPQVNAGPDQTITLPASANLSGIVTDDGLPRGVPLTILWTKVSGPANVTFSEASRPTTTATFSMAGVYVLRLTAGDSLLSSSDEVSVIVNPANQPPAVDAGADQTITLPNMAQLNGAATDDGLPVSGSLTTLWSQVSGPGSVTFGSAASLATSAAFSDPGTYVLRLTASDTELTNSDELAVTVNAKPFNSRVYTLNADFDEGSAINVVHNVPDQLQLDDTTRAFNFIWVAVSTKGTIVKINTETGAVLGEFRTAPAGQPTDPSRTTVDHNGSVWATNRAGNSVVRVGLLENGQCVDRNGNGVIETSQALGNVRAWPNADGRDSDGGVETAADECIINYVRVQSSGTRHVSVNAENDVWVSGTGGQHFDLIDGETGLIKRSERSVGYGGYGGLIDKSGVIWSARRLLRWDTSKPLSGVNGHNWLGYEHDSYGLCIDSKGNVWNTQLENSAVRKFAPDGTLVGIFPHGGFYAQGCVVGKNDDVWVAHSIVRTDLVTVGHLKNNGILVGNVTVGSGPSGVAVDAAGKIWATNYYSRTVSRINPAAGLMGTDGVTRVGQVDFTTVDLGGNLYNYSDMTGSTLTGAPREGTWTTVFDSDVAGAEWGRIGWTARVCGDGSLTVTVASSEDGTTFGPSEIVTSGADPGVANGRYLKISVSFRRAASGESPVLYDLSVGTEGFGLPATPNVPPEVNAGPDQTISLPGLATLNGSVCDDGLPRGDSLSISWSKVSGPGIVTFSKPDQVETEAAFTEPGTYVLRLSAGDSEQTSSDDVTITVTAPNQAPVPNAGPDQTIHLPEAANLDGAVTDDGLPIGSTISTLWTKVSGPGNVTFANPNVTVTSASFSVAGTYVLRLTASDSQLTGSDELTITINPPNQPPVVNAGPDQTISLPADTVNLAGTITDDGFPSGSPLTSVWSKVSGPGTVIFGDVGQRLTTAKFSGAGTYVLRLTANDSQLTSSDDMTVVVTEPNQSPVVNAGSDQTITLPQTATLNASATDDGLPIGSTVSTLWTKVSGPGNVTFANPNVTVTSATFSVAGTYVLRLTASDSQLTGSDELTVTVNPPNQPPVVNAGPDQTITLPADTVNLSGTVTDDGFPTSGTLTSMWSKVSGPGAVTFSNASQAITTATFSAAGIYVLKLTASDSLLSGSDNVTITVNAINQPPVVNAGQDQTIALPQTATLNGSATDDGLPAGSTLSISWTTVSGPETVAFSNPASAVTTASFSVAGTYVLRLTASDSLLSVSDDVTINVSPPIPPPTVSINSPSDGSEISGPTGVIGSVSNAAWKVEYSLNTDNGSAAQAWTQMSSGTGPVTNGLLGNFDPTVLLNGTYSIRLTAVDVVGQMANVSTSVVVTGDQKVGHFSISFNDLSIPVAGLPLQVIRTYDSRDKRNGDFGIGWTLDIRNVRVEKTGLTGRSWQQTRSGGILPNYCVQAIRPRVVTITFQDGKVYKFQAVVNPQCQLLQPIEFTDVGFTPMEGTRGSLSVIGSTNVFYHGTIPGSGDLIDVDTFEPYDPTMFSLTTEDGTVYVIDQHAGVRSMTDTNGNTLTINHNGIIHSSGKSVTFTRDSQGRITQITDPAGNSMFYTYDANGDLVTFSDRENNVSRYTYNATHGLLTILDPRGIQPLRNDYDADGRLIKQTDAFGNVITFAHDLSARHEIIRDRLGNPTVYEYDGHGNVLRVTDARGGVTTRTYDARDNLLTETNALGKTATYTYDAQDNRLSETDALGNTTRYTYNSRGQVLTVTDPQGRVVTSVYDANGNLTSATDPLGNTTTSTYNAKGQETSIKDGLGNVTQFAYDTAGNLASQTDQFGNVMTYTYDANGNKLSEAARRTVGGVTEALLTRYEYDRLGQPTKVTHADDSTNLMSYNVLGQQTALVDGLGRRTECEYDDMGRLARTLFPDGTREEITYDAEGRRTKLVDRAGRATVYTYDAVGRPVKAVNPDGTSASSTYDANGMMTSTTDEMGQVTRYEYDGSKHLVKITDALNNALAYTYDVHGNRASMTDPRGQVTRYEYDANHRRTRTVFPDGTAASVTYDAVGRVLSKTDQAGKTWRYEYDKRGKLLKVTDPLGSATSFTYDELGNQLTQTDANNHTTSCAYDKLGRRTRRTLPLGMSETYANDNAGQLVSRTDFNGKTTTYSYDGAGRLTSRTPDASTGQAPVIFTYTPAGQRATMIDAGGTTTYAYDARDRMTSKATPHGTLSYTYDLTGKLLTVRSSNANGVAVDYSYDALNRLAAVADRRLAAGTTAYTYDVNGNLASTLHPNGVQSTYTYDSLNRLTDVAVTKGSVIAGYAYTLGAAGNRLSVAEAGGRAVTYTYDALYRLTGEAVSGDAVAANNGAVTYTYDAVGNRLTRASGVGAVASMTSTYDANDRLQGDSFDANGNTVQSGASTYQFDSENRLTSANNEAVTFVYNGDGNRVAKTAGGVTVNYLVDTNNPTGYAQVVEELVGGQVQRQYTYGHHLISQRQLLGGQWATHFYGLDGSGSVRFLTDSAGAVTDTYTYDAFGKLTGQTGATPNSHLYVGEHFDNQLGFYYLRARYMNPETGRFRTMDEYEGTSADPLSLHKYLYANANPTNIVDPSGHMGMAISVASPMPSIAAFAKVASAALTIGAQILLTVAVAAVLLAATAIMIDRMIAMTIVMMGMTAAIAAATALMRAEFKKFRESPEFQRPGKHYIELEHMTNPFFHTDRVPVSTYMIGPVEWTQFEGGGPGRVFQFKYKIGTHGNYGRGMFLFRLDYMNYEKKPARPEFHYHLRFGKTNIDHEEL